MNLCPATPPAPAPATAPTGPLARIAPQAPRKTVQSAKALPGGIIEIQTTAGAYRVESRFSTPTPAWVTGDNAGFKLERVLDVKDDFIVVYDNFTNLTQEKLPLMRRNEIRMGGFRALTKYHFKEGVAAGVVRLVGTSRKRIVEETQSLLRDPTARLAMTTKVNPYGDGNAAARIVAALLE